MKKVAKTKSYFNKNNFRFPKHHKTVAAISHHYLDVKSGQSATHFHRETVSPSLSLPFKLCHE